MKWCSIMIPSAMLILAFPHIFHHHMALFKVFFAFVRFFYFFLFFFKVGKWNVVGGMPNVTQFPPMWYEFADRPDLHDFVKDIVDLDEHWAADPLRKVWIFYTKDFFHIFQIFMLKKRRKILVACRFRERSLSSQKFTLTSKYKRGVYGDF